MQQDTANDWRAAAAADYRKRREAIIERRNIHVQVLERARAKIARDDEELAELDRAALVFGIRPPAAPEPTPTAKEPRGGRQFKDIALDLLRQAYPKTLKASQIQIGAQRALAREFHPKTAGMTLYRLSQDGLVERVGRAEWKYVPQKGEGPGAEASEPSMFS